MMFDEDSETENASAEVSKKVDLEEEIALLESIPPEMRPALGKYNSEFALKRLLPIAQFLNITNPRKANKAGLVDMIYQSLDDKKALKARMASSTLFVEGATSTRHFEPDTGSSSTFRADRHTFPRLCNIVFRRPNQVIASKGLADRGALQANQVYERNDLWLQVAKEFNDFEFNSGGLVCDNPMLHDIDPERNNLGIIDAARCMKIFDDTRKRYARTYSNFDVSGRHAGNDFIRFCGSDLDVLYLHLALLHMTPRNTDFESFCREGYKIGGGSAMVDAVESTPQGSSKSTASSTSTLTGSKAISANALLSFSVDANVEVKREKVALLKRKFEEDCADASHLRRQTKLKAAREMINTMEELRNDLAKAKEAGKTEMATQIAELLEATQEEHRNIMASLSQGRS